MGARSGGCRCGALRYAVAGAALAGIACHCRDCQYAAGGGSFCGTCGVQVFSQPDSNPGLVAVKVGSLDDSSDFRVDADIWMASAPAWHRRHEGARQFPHNPEG